MEDPDGDCSMASLDLYMETLLEENDDRVETGSLKISPPDLKSSVSSMDLYSDLDNDDFSDNVTARSSRESVENAHESVNDGLNNQETAPVSETVPEGVDTVSVSMKKLKAELVLTRTVQESVCSTAATCMVTRMVPDGVDAVSGPGSFKSVPSKDDDGNTLSDNGSREKCTQPSQKRDADWWMAAHRELQQKYTELEEKYARVNVNMRSLILTARTEIKKKDSLISQLGKALAAAQSQPPAACVCTVSDKCVASAVSTTNSTTTVHSVASCHSAVDPHGTQIVADSAESGETDNTCSAAMSKSSVSTADPAHPAPDAWSPDKESPRGSQSPDSTTHSPPDLPNSRRMTRGSRSPQRPEPLKPSQSVEKSNDMSQLPVDALSPEVLRKLHMLVPALPQKSLPQRSDPPALSETSPSQMLEKLPSHTLPLKLQSPVLLQKSPEKLQECRSPELLQKAPADSLQTCQSENLPLKEHSADFPQTALFEQLPKASIDCTEMRESPGHLCVPPESPVGSKSPEVQRTSPLMQIGHQKSISVDFEGSVECPNNGSVECPNNGSVECPNNGSVECPKTPGSTPSSHALQTPKSFQSHSQCQLASPSSGLIPHPQSPDCSQSPVHSAVHGDCPSPKPPHDAHSPLSCRPSPGFQQHFPPTTPSCSPPLEDCATTSHSQALHRNRWPNSSLPPDSSESQQNAQLDVELAMADVSVGRIRNGSVNNSVETDSTDMTVHSQNQANHRSCFPEVRAALQVKTTTRAKAIESKKQSLNDSQSRSDAKHTFNTEQICEDALDSAAVPREDALDSVTVPREDALDSVTVPCEDALDSAAVPREDALDSVVPREDALDSVVVPREDALDSVVVPREDALESAAVPREDALDSVVVPREDALDSAAVPREDALDSVTVPREDALDSLTVPCEDALDSVVVPREDALDSVVVPREDALDSVTVPREDALDSVAVLSSISHDRDILSMKITDVVQHSVGEQVPPPLEIWRLSCTETSPQICADTTSVCGTDLECEVGKLADRCLQSSSKSDHQHHTGTSLSSACDSFPPLKSHWPTTMLTSPPSVEAVMMTDSNTDGPGTSINRAASGIIEGTPESKIPETHSQFTPLFQNMKGRVWRAKVKPWPSGVCEVMRQPRPQIGPHITIVHTSWDVDPKESSCDALGARTAVTCSVSPSTSTGSNDTNLAVPVCTSETSFGSADKLSNDAANVVDGADSGESCFSIDGLTEPCTTCSDVRNKDFCPESNSVTGVVGGHNVIDTQNVSCEPKEPQNIDQCTMEIEGEKDFYVKISTSSKEDLPKKEKKEKKREEKDENNKQKEECQKERKRAEKDKETGQEKKEEKREKKDQDNKQKEECQKERKRAEKDKETGQEKKEAKREKKDQDNKQKEECQKERKRAEKDKETGQEKKEKVEKEKREKGKNDQENGKKEGMSTERKRKERDEEKEKENKQKRKDKRFRKQGTESCSDEDPRDGPRQELTGDALDTEYRRSHGGELTSVGRERDGVDVTLHKHREGRVESKENRAKKGSDLKQKEAANCTEHLAADKDVKKVLIELSTQTGRASDTHSLRTANRVDAPHSQNIKTSPRMTSEKINTSPRMTSEKEVPVCITCNDHGVLHSQSQLSMTGCIEEMVAHFDKVKENRDHLVLAESKNKNPDMKSLNINQHHDQNEVPIRKDVNTAEVNNRVANTDQAYLDISIYTDESDSDVSPMKGRLGFSAVRNLTFLRRPSLGASDVTDISDNEVPPSAQTTECSSSFALDTVRTTEKGSKTTDNSVLAGIEKIFPEVDLSKSRATQKNPQLLLVMHPQNGSKNTAPVFQDDSKMTTLLPADESVDTEPQEQDSAVPQELGCKSPVPKQTLSLFGSIQVSPVKTSSTTTLLSFLPSDSTPEDVDGKTFGQKLKAPLMSSFLWSPDKTRISTPSLQKPMSSRSYNAFLGLSECSMTCDNSSILPTLSAGDCTRDNALPFTDAQTMLKAIPNMKQKSEVAETLSHKPGVCSLSHSAVCSLSHKPGVCSLSQKPDVCSLSHKPGVCSLSHKPGVCSLSHKPGVCLLSHKPGVCSSPSNVDTGISECDTKDDEDSSRQMDFNSPLFGYPAHSIKLKGGSRFKYQRKHAPFESSSSTSLSTMTTSGCVSSTSTSASTSSTSLTSQSQPAQDGLADARGGPKRRLSLGFEVMSDVLEIEEPVLTSSITSEGDNAVFADNSAIDAHRPLSNSMRLHQHHEVACGMQAVCPSSPECLTQPEGLEDGELENTSTLTEPVVESASLHTATGVSHVIDNSLEEGELSSRDGTHSQNNVHTQILAIVQSPPRMLQSAVGDDAQLKDLKEMSQLKSSLILRIQRKDQHGATGSHKPDSAGGQQGKPTKRAPSDDMMENVLEALYDVETERQLYIPKSGNKKRRFPTNNENCPPSKRTCTSPGPAVPGNRQTQNILHLENKHSVVHKTEDESPRHCQMTEQPHSSLTPSSEDLDESTEYICVDGSELSGQEEADMEESFCMSDAGSELSGCARTRAYLRLATGRENGENKVDFDDVDSEERASRGSDSEVEDEENSDSEGGHQEVVTNKDSDRSVGESDGESVSGDIGQTGDGDDGGAPQKIAEEVDSSCEDSDGEYEQAGGRSDTDGDTHCAAEKSDGDVEDLHDGHTEGGGRKRGHHDAPVTDHGPQSEDLSSGSSQLSDSDFDEVFDGEKDVKSEGEVQRMGSRVRAVTSGTCRELSEGECEDSVSDSEEEFSVPTNLATGGQCEGGNAALSGACDNSLVLTPMKDGFVPTNNTNRLPMWTQSTVDCLSLDAADNLSILTGHKEASQHTTGGRVFAAVGQGQSSATEVSRRDAELCPTSTCIAKHGMPITDRLRLLCASSECSGGDPADTTNWPEPRQDRQVHGKTHHESVKSRQCDSKRHRHSKSRSQERCKTAHRSRDAGKSHRTDHGMHNRSVSPDRPQRQPRNSRNSGLPRGLGKRPCPCCVGRRRSPNRAGPRQDRNSRRKSLSPRHSGHRLEETHGSGGTCSERGRHYRRPGCSDICLHCCSSSHSCPDRHATGHAHNDRRCRPPNRRSADKRHSCACCSRWQDSVYRSSSHSPGNADVGHGHGESRRSHGHRCSHSRSRSRSKSPVRHRHGKHHH